jgi:transcriptional regulator with XRE-family HTH domain
MPIQVPTGPLETIGHRIANARNTLGMSATDLARFVKVTPTAVWNWEKNGVRPRQEVLQSVAEVLNVPIEWLTIGAEKSNPATTPHASTHEIVEAARKAIANATGFPIERVKLNLELVAE